MRTLAQSFKWIQSLCILNNRLFLGERRDLSIHEFSLHGEHVKSWLLPPQKSQGRVIKPRRWVEQLRGYKDRLFIAAGQAGVIICTPDGVLIREITNIDDAIGVDVDDDENIFIQSPNVIYICTSEGHYIASFQLPWSVLGGIELASQFVFSISKNFEVRVNNITDHRFPLTVIETRSHGFCILHDIGCIAILCDDGSVDFHCLQTTTTTTTTIRTCACVAL
jgi:hypothetical protein